MTEPNELKYDEKGMRLTDCCGAHSTYMDAGRGRLAESQVLCCKACYHEVEPGQGDGCEWLKGKGPIQFKVPLAEGAHANVNSGSREVSGMGIKMYPNPTPGGSLGDSTVWLDWISRATSKPLKSRTRIDVTAMDQLCLEWLKARNYIRPTLLVMVNDIEDVVSYFDTEQDLMDFGIMEVVKDLYSRENGIYQISLRNGGFELDGFAHPDMAFDEHAELADLLLLHSAVRQGFLEDDQAGMDAFFEQFGNFINEDDLVKVIEIAKTKINTQETS